MERTQLENRKHSVSALAGFGIVMAGLMGPAANGQQVLEATELLLEPSIVGTWYETEFRYEVYRDGPRPLERFNGGQISISRVDGTADDYWISENGEAAEQVRLVQNGSRWTSSQSFIGEGTGTRREQVNAQWIRDGLLLVSQVSISYSTDLRIEEFEGSVMAMTREPLPAVQAASWEGVWNGVELGYEAYNGTNRLDFFRDQLTAEVNAMAGNTYRVYTDGDTINLAAVGDVLALNARPPTYNRITYQDSDWTVRVTTAQDIVRVLQIDADTLFVGGFWSRMGRIDPIDPEKHGNPGPEYLIHDLESYALIFEREQGTPQPVSPLDSGCTGNLLAQQATSVGDGSDWFYISWLGYLQPQGSNWAELAGVGTVFFGADCEAEAGAQAWLYVARDGKWLLFGEAYGYGLAWDPTVAAVVEIDYEF